MPDAVDRVNVFRAQLVEWRAVGRSGVPFFALPGRESSFGSCLSCGVPLDAGRLYRCATCLEAVHVVMKSESRSS